MNKLKITPLFFLCIIAIGLISLIYTPKVYAYHVGDYRCNGITSRNPTVVKALNHSYFVFVEDNPSSTTEKLYMADITNETYLIQVDTLTTANTNYWIFAVYPAQHPYDDYCYIVGFEAPARSGYSYNQYAKIWMYNFTSDTTTEIYSTSNFWQGNVVAWYTPEDDQSSLIFSNIWYVSNIGVICVGGIVHKTHDEVAFAMIELEGQTVARYWTYIDQEDWELTYGLAMSIKSSGHSPSIILVNYVARKKCLFIKYLLGGTFQSHKVYTHSYTIHRQLFYSKTASNRHIATYLYIPKLVQDAFYTIDNLYAISHALPVYTTAPNEESGVLWITLYSNGQIKPSWYYKLSAVAYPRDVTPDLYTYNFYWFYPSVGKMLITEGEPDEVQARTFDLDIEPNTLTYIVGAFYFKKVNDTHISLYTSLIPTEIPETELPEGETYYTVPEGGSPEAGEIWIGIIAGSLLVPFLLMFIPPMILGEQVGMLGFIVGLIISTSILYLAGLLPLWTVFLVGLGIISALIFGKRGMPNE